MLSPIILLSYPLIGVALLFFGKFKNEKNEL